MTATTPVTTSHDVEVGPTATGTLTDVRWPAMDELALTCPDIHLSAGRWLVMARISSSPGMTSGRTASFVDDVTLASSDTVSVDDLALDVYRDIDGQARTAHASIEVQKWIDGEWHAYARGQVDVTIPAAPAAVPAERYGSSVHLLLNVQTGAVESEGNVTQLTPFLDALEDAGADIVRTSIAWLYMQPSSGGGVLNSTFAGRVDTFMSACASRGIDVILQIGGVPTWAGPGYSGTVPTNGNIDQWVDAVLDRWTPYAVEWDNEPNTGFYYSPGTPVNATWLTRVQNRVYDRCQLADTPPLFGGSGMAFGDAAYVDAMYDAGMGGHIDYISIHPYDVRFDGADRIGAPQYPWEHDDTGVATGTHGPAKWLQAVHAVYRVMRDHGDGDVPIWITEGGWSSSILHSDAGFRCSERQQADYTEFALRQIARVPFVTHVLTYNTYDGAAPLTTWDGFGLLRKDATPKLAYASWMDTVADLRS